MNQYFVYPQTGSIITEEGEGEEEENNSDKNEDKMIEDFEKDIEGEMIHEQAKLSELVIVDSIDEDEGDMR